MRLEEFLGSVELTGDPFAHTNADEEELLASYFVPPPYFNDVRGLPSTPKSCVVFAPRGGGKSAQRRIIEIEATSDEAKYLCVLYERFPLGRPSVAAHLEEICLRLTVAALMNLEAADTGALLKEVDRDFLIGEAASLDAIGREKFDELVQSLKSDVRKAGDWLRDHSGPVKAVVAALLAKRGIELDPTLPWGPQMAKAKEIPPLARLDRHIELARAMGFESVYVLVDRLDETAGTATSPKAAIELVVDLLLDLKVMELPGLAVKVFAWNLSHDHYVDCGGRSDRIREFSLAWSVQALEEMMSRRLRAFSNEKVESLNDLLAVGSPLDFHRLAAIMANGSPRDMIRFCARVVGEHLNSDANANITDAEIWAAVRLFSAEICDERAKKYMPDLLRLDRYRFTQNLVANDYLKISKQSTGAKVGEWRRTAMVDKIAELQDNRNRPQHLYAVTDPRLAIALRPSLEPAEILDFYAFQCPQCEATNYCDEIAFDCANCQRHLESSRTPSLMSSLKKG